MGKPFMRLDGKTGNFRGQSRSVLLRAFAVASGIGLFFGLVGPYGSYLNGDLSFRTLYWITCSLIGFTFYAGPIVFMRRAGLIGQGARFWCVIAGITALIGILQSWVTRQLAEIMWPEKVARLPGWGLWYVQVLLIALPAVMLTVLWLRHRERRSAPELPPISLETQAPGQSSSAIADELLSPHPRPDSILALQMEDHYIRCHRQGGSILVHGTLRDAMARQSSCDGLQVHRSWWVARPGAQALGGHAACPASASDERDCRSGCTCTGRSTARSRMARHEGRYGIGYVRLYGFRGEKLGHAQRFVRLIDFERQCGAVRLSALSTHR